MKKIIFIAFALLMLCGCCNQKNGNIKIGAILPLTGSSAQYGQWIKDALEMAKLEINKSGGINGKDLIIIYEDDKGDPKTTVNAMEKLANIDNVPVVFGSFNSGCVLAQAPIAEKTKTPMLAEAQSPRIRDAGDYVFRIQPDSRLYMQYFIPYIFNDLNIHKIAILYINNAFGNDITDIFISDYGKLGGNITNISEMLGA